MFKQNLEDALRSSREFKAKRDRFERRVSPGRVWARVFVLWLVVNILLSVVLAWGAPQLISIIRGQGSIIEERIALSHSTGATEIDPDVQADPDGDGQADETAASATAIPFAMVMSEYLARVAGVVPPACSLSERNAVFPKAPQDDAQPASYVSVLHWAAVSLGQSEASVGQCDWRGNPIEVVLVSVSPDVGFIQKVTLVLLLFGLSVLGRGQIAREIDLESFPDSNNRETPTRDEPDADAGEAGERGGGFVMKFSQWANHPVIVSPMNEDPVTCPLYPVDPLVLDDPGAPTSRTHRYLNNVHLTKRMMRHPALTWPMEMIEDIVSTGTSGRSKADADTRMREVLEDYRNAVEKRFAWVEFQLWLLPTIGFLGTIFGISISLVRAKGLFGDDVDSGKAINEVVDGLGVAFDTTSMALASAALLYFLLRMAEERNEHLLRAAKRALTNFLVRRLTV